MSDVTAATAAVTDTSVSTPAVETPAPAPVVAAPVAPSPPATPSEPAWLPDRIKRAEETAVKAALKQLGFDKPGDAKAALDELKRRQDAEKSESQRLTEENASLKARAAKADEYELIYRAQVDAELAKLPKDQQDLVTELAGDDIAKRAKAIERLKASAAVASTEAAARQAAEAAAKPAVAAASPAPAAPVAPAPSATTAPTTSSPAPVSATGESHLATWQRLREENRILAANYRLTHLKAIEAEQKTRV